MSLKEREQKWYASQEVPYIVIPAIDGDDVRTDDSKKEIQRYECSYYRCKAYQLRWTPSGIWCREHYIGQPSCSVCGVEPALHPKDDSQGRCRTCWRKSYDD